MVTTLDQVNKAQSHKPRDKYTGIWQPPVMRFGRMGFRFCFSFFLCVNVSAFSLRWSYWIGTVPVSGSLPPWLFSPHLSPTV